MKISPSFLKLQGFAKTLPKEIFTVTSTQFLVFFYQYNDENSRIADIQGVKIVNSITMQLYLNIPYNTNTGVLYSLGYFQPFYDTQSTLFYQFCYYYCEMDMNSEREVESLKLAFRLYYASDYQNIEKKQKETTYNNIFNIQSRDDFYNAVDRFVISDSDKKTDIMLVCDSIDNAIKNSLGKSLYEKYLERIVFALKNPNGGLIPDVGGRMRYLYVGVKSYLEKSSSTLTEAKNMFRSKFSASEIHLKTGWFLNKHDNKWRTRISDSESYLLPTKSPDSFFVRGNSNYNSGVLPIEDIIAAFASGNDSAISNVCSTAINNGWDTYLPDVLIHPTLYSHYPQLLKLPVFYYQSTKASPKFFHNGKDNYIVMCGNSYEQDFRTILLHETQHAIQIIESFATGGNLFLASIIESMGGKGLRNFVFLKQKAYSLFIQNFAPNKKHSWDRYILEIGINRTPLKYRENPDLYYKDAENIFNLALSNFFDNKTIANSTYGEYLGEDITGIFNEISDIVDKGRNNKRLLISQGYTEREIQKFYFDAYESIAGEIEARDTQHLSYSEDDMQDLFLPLTSEAIQEDDITAVYDDMYSDILYPKIIKGAIEDTEDGKYIIHLFESVSAQPIMHELSHIFYDYVKEQMQPDVNIEDAIKNTFSEDTINQYLNLGELFCEMVLSWLSKQKTSDSFHYDISTNRKLLGVDYGVFEKIFSDIFLFKTDNKKDAEFAKRIEFIKQLYKLIN
jgi:hypothetical protein